MSTELSWTELRRGAGDLRALLAFRRTGLSPASRRRLQLGAVLLVALTLVAIMVPAYLREPLHGRDTNRLVAILPTFYLGFLVLAVLGAVTSGGGREVIPREQAVALPITAVTEHLGALLLAPLNIAWLIQAWVVLGATTYVLGPENLAGAAVPVLLWIAFATAAGQAVGWAYEGVRRGWHGIVVARMISGATLLAVGAVVVAGRTTALLDQSPTVRVYVAAANASVGDWLSWTVAVATLVGMLTGVTLLGLIPARWALHRPQREELRLESGHREPRLNPRSDLAAMVRLDRASIWRSVPLRRGLFVLGMLPGAVALAGELTWDLITVLPGLVASGGALLFGVNAWSLDGRGALWRDSLPAPPRVAFASKVVVLFEVLLVSGTLTIVLAATRAGRPTSAEFAAVVVALLVVSAQVVVSALRWSVTTPYAVDLRSARATPAPPVVMAAYSARLAVKTTMVGLVFSATSLAPDWRTPVLIGVPFLCWSGYRLLRTADAWATPTVRARVIATVAS